MPVDPSCGLLAPARLVSGPLWKRLQPTGNGTLYSRNEAIVHAKQLLERPSTRDLVVGLVLFVPDPAVHMRRSTDRLAAAGGHTDVPGKTTERELIRGA
jgi:hypothetical protein